MFRSILIALSCVLLSTGTVAQDAHRILQREIESFPGSPKVLAVYMAWFGDPRHINVGYSSQDRDVLRHQIVEARNLGISAFLVDWKGDRQPFSDRSFSLLIAVAEESHFEVALLYDEPDNPNEQKATQQAISELDHAYKAYIGPQAPHRNAYLTYDGRPVLFIFSKHGHANWNQIREHLGHWSKPPLLLYKDDPPPPFTDDFDGFFPWVHPGHGGWSPDGSDWGQQYLDEFYKKMQARYAHKVIVGAAWPGFDDSRASWSLNRRMNPRCGETLEDTLRLAREVSRKTPLPFLLIETWNDYEEGTALERTERLDCRSRESRR